MHGCRVRRVEGAGYVPKLWLLSTQDTAVIADYLLSCRVESAFKLYTPPFLITYKIVYAKKRTKKVGAQLASSELSS